MTADGTYPMKHLDEGEKNYLRNERKDFIQFSTDEEDYFYDQYEAEKNKKKKKNRSKSGQQVEDMETGVVKSEAEKVAEIIERAKDRGAATVEHDCVKCGFGVAEYKAIQMRSADEGQSIFYTCLKCKHTEKDADS